MSKQLIVLGAALLGLAACQSAPQTEQPQLNLIGTWHIEVAQSKPVIDYSPAKLTFAEDGQLSGNNSCNQLFGQYSVEGQQVSIMPAGNTMKACVEALMVQEQRVMGALPLISQGKMSQGKLLLQDEQGNTQLILSRL
ncbi:META domain-containing protein [Shewanella sp. Scap07]|uniref:META domain-containing protein n=1 Tax=Shewanella sp. Scap07 TaxID=2589987 RepID=UPI0015BB8A81|nr:META domain-containing protein [Shewanella sp. Scap07]QLE84329.1 META domain-containing protein [Shewanella sp. Scap07]